jgi:cysteine synthase
MRMAIYAAALLATASLMAKSAIDPEVATLISQTRETRSIYAVYMWQKITPKGEETIESWSAEFHSGNLHRVEIPEVRIVADCEAMTGTQYIVETGERLSGIEIAKAACGIQANSKIVSARKLGTRKTSFGKATIIEIIDPSERRTYDISDEGILLGQTISDKGKGGHLWVSNKAMEVLRELPDDDIFSEKSLERSVVHTYF